MLAAALVLALLTPAPPPTVIELRATFDVPAPVLFAYLHAPDRIRWLGPFRLTRPASPPQPPSGRGSVRRVSLGRRVVVEETITRFDPPCAMDYAVTRSRAYRDHHATMRVISPSPSRSELLWSITYVSAKRNPERHRRFTRRYLRRALHRLRREFRRLALEPEFGSPPCPGPRR